MPEKRGGPGRGQGRKPTPAADALKPGSIRLTPAQWERFYRLGGAAWLRKIIEEKSAENPRTI